MTSRRYAPWPWPAFAGGGRHPARDLIGLLSGLPVIGWETSCRFSARGIETCRLLAAVRRATLSIERWHALLAEAGVPAVQRADLDAQLPQADRVCFAFEQGSQSAAVTRKVYLERDAGFAQRDGERLTIVGYKWKQGTQAAEAGRRVTEYWTVDLADARSMIDGLGRSASREVAIAEGAMAATDKALAQVVRTISVALADALARSAVAGTWRHRQVRVGETGHPRASLAFNFYDSGLLAGDLRAAVLALAGDWSLDPDAINKFFDVIAERELAWLAGGLGTDGKSFLSFYCCGSRDDAIQACYSADPSLAQTTSASTSQSRGDA